MGNVISVADYKAKPQFILVLSPSEAEWGQADRVILSAGSVYVPSYYLIEQADRLKDAGLLDNYSACLLVGAEAMTYQNKLQIKKLAAHLPMILLKQSDKVYDFMLESLMSETILSSEIYNAGAKNKLNKCVCRNGLARSNSTVSEHSLLQCGNGDVICQQVVEASSATDFEDLMNDVVGGLNLVAQFKGVELDWQPCGETLPVDLDPIDVKRALMGILLEAFQGFSKVTLRISPKSLLSDHCIWLDISASQPKPCPNLDSKVNDSDALKSLGRTIDMNHGQLYVLDADEKSLNLRIEWHAMEHC